jgi:hypothetical protein
MSLKQKRTMGMKFKEPWYYGSRSLVKPEASGVKLRFLHTSVTIIRYY